MVQNRKGPSAESKLWSALLCQQNWPHAGQAVDLEDMLMAREARRRRQEALAAEIRDGTLVAFNLNIAGPVKRGRALDSLALLSWRRLLLRLASVLGAAPYGAEIFWEPSGFYACCAWPGFEATQIKAEALAYESELNYGRLLDIDIWQIHEAQAQHKISREDLGQAAACCLLCTESAFVCARSRRHSVEDLRAEAEHLAQAGLQLALKEHCCQLASRALLAEVELSPKPGLVDRFDNGVHDDMDLNSFYASTRALEPYWCQAWCLGEGTANVDAAAFRELQLAGLDAEKAMLEATGGANTHGGLIYSLGLLIWALAHSMQRYWFDSQASVPSFEKAAQLAADLAQKGLQNQDLARLDGARAELVSAFASIREISLPFVEEERSLLPKNGKLSDEFLDRLHLRLFWHLLARIDDKNLRRRGGAELLAQLQRGLRAVNWHGVSDEELAGWQEKTAVFFQAHRLSPGGTADLLALTYFVEAWNEMFKADEV